MMCKISESTPDGESSFLESGGQRPATLATWGDDGTEIGAFLAEEAHATGRKVVFVVALVGGVSVAVGGDGGGDGGAVGGGGSGGDVVVAVLVVVAAAAVVVVAVVVVAAAVVVVVVVFVVVHLNSNRRRT